MNAVPVAQAGVDRSTSVGVPITLDGTASTDADGDALTYAWALGNAPAGSTAALVSAGSSRPGFTPDVAGSYSINLIVSDGKASSSAASVKVTALVPVAPAIVVSAAEPLAGTVQLSLSHAAAGSVTWYVDTALLGIGGTAAGAPLAWNTNLVANGAHLIVARIQTSATAFEEVRRTVTVANSTFTLTGSVSGTSGLINVDVRATSTPGIASVAATFDGANAGSLAAPNACSLTVCAGPPSFDIFRFTVDAAKVGSGGHTMVITATDRAGASKQISVPVPVSNAPVLGLTSPLDGAVASGTLQVAGTASSDKPDVITVTAQLGAVEFLRTTAANFTASYDLTGLNPGTYTLIVTATDSSRLSSQVVRSVVVTSSGVPVYTPLFSLPAGGQLLAVEGSRVLYTAAGGNVALRDVTAGTEVFLANAASFGWDDAKLSGGRVYQLGALSDCSANDVCVYTWDAAGKITNLSAGHPSARTGVKEALVARDGFVSWVNSGSLLTNQPGSYSLYDAATGSITEITPPAGVIFVGNRRYDFASSGGVVQFYFWAASGSVSTTTTISYLYDIYNWRSDSGSVSLVSAGGQWNLFPQTDGARVAWVQDPIGGNANQRSALLTRPVAGGASTVLSNLADADRLSLRDGVLAWNEGAGGSTLKANTVGAAGPVLTVNDGSPLANAEGWVVYGQQGKVYSWSSSSGASTLRLDATPSQVFISGGAAFFVVGTTVYRVPLQR